MVQSLIPLDYPDIDVIRVDDTYYIVSTTMYFMPGCEILESKDLHHWKHTTYVYDRLEDTPEENLQDGKNAYGKGMWAASLRYHKGTFYMCFVANDTGKTYLYQTNDIKGEWKRQEIEGFYHDCSLLFDDDDRVYIVYGNRQLYLTELNEDLTAPKQGGLHRVIVEDTKEALLGYEGSHLYKIDGRYYLFLIHSLAERWMRAQACYVADSLEGEFTGRDVFVNDIGYCGSGVAQGGIVDTPDGDWYAILFQDRGAVGRIPVLVPVTWGEDFGKPFPDFLDPRERDWSFSYEGLAESDDFTTTDGESFGFKSCWQFNHNPDLSLVKVENKAVHFTTKDICTDLLQAKNTLTQRMKFPESDVCVTLDASKMQVGDRAGLCALQGCYGALTVVREEDGFYLEVNTRSKSKDGFEEKVSERVSLSDAKVMLRIVCNFDHMKDTATFYYLDWETGNWKEIGSPHKLIFGLDHFTGCRAGLFYYSTVTPGGTVSFSDFKN